MASNPGATVGFNTDQAEQIYVALDGEYEDQWLRDFLDYIVDHPPMAYTGNVTDRNIWSVTSHEVTPNS